MHPTHTPDRAVFPRNAVDEVLTDLLLRLDPKPALGKPQALCERVCAVGGYRRGKREMKDLELLYIPEIRQEEDPADMFGRKIEVNVTERLWHQLVAAGVLEQRLKVDGSVSAWGAWNKHARHVASGLPVDLFAATWENYANRLVVTTGPRESNIRIAAAARAKGWEWEVAEAGFVPLGKTWATATRERRTMRSEREVFAFVDLPFRLPEERE